MNIDTAIIIPSRIGSTRLPEKPLKIIGDMTMIEHVVKRALESHAGEVFVATDSDEIADKVVAAGASAIMVREEVATGTDRVWAALEKIDPEERFKYIVNLQGDLPLVDPAIITNLVDHLKSSDCDIVTPVVKTESENPNNEGNVQAIMGANNRALYFSRNNIPIYSDWYWYHIGIYGFKRDALKKFVNLPQSHLELTEKLEQLRAIENGMIIELSIAENSAVSVDTQEDLDKVILEYNTKFI